MTWLHKIRLRILAICFGVALAALAVVSMTTLPALPVVGVAVAAVAMVINKAAARLSATVCLGCGKDLAKQPLGEHGLVCPECGTLSHKPAILAKGDIESHRSQLERESA